MIACKEELNIDINNAKLNELIRVPGIGLKTAHKIIESRPIKDVLKLRSLGVIIKRASPFIEFKGLRQTKFTRWIN
jgi:predicted DNA-binding helix-hairpin-helix protein